jgi:mRNA interferase YafQ
MRTIDRASSFKRDYKREAKGQYRTTLDGTLRSILVALATDQPLSPKYRDHDLSGDGQATVNAMSSQTFC